MPTISIIIPVYNVEKYLKQCLDSVLVDNQFSGQVICVNDGSTDGSLAILEEYVATYPNVEIISQPNAGLSAARNAGLDRATGDYVFFPDSDDWVFPGSIERMMSRIDGEEVLYFNAKVFYEEKLSFGQEIDIMEVRHMDGQAYFAAIYGQPRNMPCVCVWGGCYKRSFMLANKLHFEKGIYHEDNYFTPQVLLAAKDVSCINEYLYVYRIRKGSITAHVTEKHIRDILFVARNLYAKYEKRGDVPEVFYKDICQIYVNLIENVYNSGLSLHKYWHIVDSIKMLKGACDVRSRKIAKLTFLSPRLAYKYMKNALPGIWRRFVNKFM